MTKDEAEREVLARWKALPDTQRKTFKQAQEFAEIFAASVDFRTMGDKTKLVTAWLVREIDRPRLEAAVHDERRVAAPAPEPVAEAVPVEEADELVVEEAVAYGPEQEAEDDRALQAGDQEHEAESEHGESPEQFGPPDERAGERVASAG